MWVYILECEIYPYRVYKGIEDKERIWLKKLNVVVEIRKRKERKKNINYVTILNWNRSKKGNREKSCAN